MNFEAFTLDTTAGGMCLTTSKGEFEKRVSDLSWEMKTWEDMVHDDILKKTDVLALLEEVRKEFPDIKEYLCKLEGHRHEIHYWDYVNDVGVWRERWLGDGRLNEKKHENEKP